MKLLRKNGEDMPEWNQMCGMIENIILDTDREKLTIVTDTGHWEWHAIGQCCAVAYVGDWDKQEAEKMIGKTIRCCSTKSGNTLEEKTQDDDSSSSNVTDINFYEIECDKDTLTITLYTEHNGYYSGSLECSAYERFSHVERLARAYNDPTIEE